MLPAASASGSSGAGSSPQPPITACATDGGAAPSLDAQLDALTASPVKLVVFDFDLCVLCIHSFAAKINVSEVSRRAAEGSLAADFVDLPLFQGVIRGLLQRGLPVAVASFGRYEVIQAYLSAAFGAGDCPFSRANISTPSIVGGADGCNVPGGKVPQLAALCEQFGVEGGVVLFFDDDVNNIALAKTAGFPLSVHTPQGVTREAFATAVACAVKAAPKRGFCGAA